MHRNGLRLACTQQGCCLLIYKPIPAAIRCIPHYVTQRDVERNNCSLEQVQYRHFPRPYVYTRGCGYARLGAARDIQVVSCIAGADLGFRSEGGEVIAARDAPPSKGVWGSAVSSSIWVWGGAPAALQLSHFLT